MSVTPDKSEASRILAIIAALREELAAVTAGIPAEDRALVQMIRGGVGPQSAGKAAAQCNARWVCSTGFCGGLTDQLNVGDIVVASAIVDGSAATQTASVTIDPTLVQNVLSALKSAGVVAHSGVITSVRDPVLACDSKRALGQSAAAIAVDMESFAISAACTGKMFVLRSVSDSVNDELPVEVSGFLDAEGNVRAGNITRFVLKRPTNIKKLMELKARSDIAARSLTAAWKAGWPVIRARTHES